MQARVFPFHHAASRVMIIVIILLKTDEILFGHQFDNQKSRRITSMECQA